MLHYLSHPATSRWSDELAELRRAAEASCFAIKEQEFDVKAIGARLYFNAAIRAGSRDSRDLLCWAATFFRDLTMDGRCTAPLMQHTKTAECASVQSVLS